MFSTLNSFFIFRTLLNLSYKATCCCCFFLICKFFFSILKLKLYLFSLHFIEQYIILFIKCLVVNFAYIGTYHV